MFRLDELSRLQVEATDHELKMDGDPRSFKLAAEATPFAWPTPAIPSSPSALPTSTLSIQDERRHLDDLRRRQVGRLGESQRAASLGLGAPEIAGTSAVVPVLAAAGRTTGPAMQRSNPVEEAAMAQTMASEQAQGRQVADVHAEDRGYSLISRGPAAQVRYIEVKGRAGVGDVALSHNEWLKAQELGDDYWLDVVSNALPAPNLQAIQNPAQRLRGGAVVERARSRVRQAGWQRVAEEGVVWEA